MVRWNGAYWGNGRQICSDPNSSISQYTIIGDHASGLYVCWREMRDYEYNVFLQCLDFEGDPRWAAEGINVSISGAYEPMMISDGQGGVIVSWDGSPGMGSCIMAQRIDVNGDFLWTAGGITTSLYPYSNDNMAIISDGRGGAVMVWEDELPDPWDLYAQHIDALGYIASPEPVISTVEDIPMDQGGKVEVAWDASYLDLWPYQEISQYSVWKSLSPASAMMLEESGIGYTELQDIGLDGESEPGMPCGIIIRRETVGAATYYWELIATQAAQYYEGYSKVVDTDFTSFPTSWTWSYYQVAAHAADPLMVWTSQPDSGYSLDNLAPTAPAGLAGEQEYSPEGMDLVWNSNTEPDLSHYVIYRGAYPTFVPSGANILASAYDTTYFDGGWTWEPGYVYKVSAVDIHHNESGYALLLPGQVTGDDPPTPQYSDYLAQNFPNPFNPSTTIQFGIKRTSRVRLSVYDTSGRLVRELINGTLPAGDYSEIWNGTNSSGQHVSSGLYFYRLDAGEFSARKKMILLR
jgi:hypothetical protein